jgi:hypothetical protein
MEQNHILAEQNHKVLYIQKARTAVPKKKMKCEMIK